MKPATPARIGAVTLVLLVIGASLGQDELTIPRVPAEQLLPLAEYTRLFRIIEGDREGEHVPLTLRPARAEQDEPGDWVLALSDLNRLYLQRDGQGNVNVVRLDLPREDRAVVYDPMVRLIPAQLEPQLAAEVAGRARVYSLESGEQTHTGKVTHEIEQVSRTRFQTAAGEREGYLIVIDHEVNMDLGNVRLGLETGYVPGHGMVYRHMRYTIEKLGLFGDTTRRTAILAEPLDGE